MSKEHKELEKLETTTGQVEPDVKVTKEAPAKEELEEVHASKVVEAKPEKEKVLDIHTSKLKAIFQKKK